MIDISVTLEEINKRSLLNMANHLGLRFTALDSHFLQGTIPVDERTKQPLGMLNGGASACLAETVGSMAAYLSVDRSQYYTLGLELKINHLRPVLSGLVTATAKPKHIGKKTHLWEIENRNDAGQLVSFATLTMAVVELDDVMKEQFKDLFFRA